MDPYKFQLYKFHLLHYISVFNLCHCTELKLYIFLPFLLCSLLHFMAHFTVLWFLGLFGQLLRVISLSFSVKTSKLDSVSLNWSARPLDILISIGLLDTWNIPCPFPFLSPFPSPFSFSFLFQNTDCRNHPSMLGKSFATACIFSVPYLPWI